MIAFVFFGLLAFASAAPHFHHHRHREPFTNFSPPHGRHSYSSSAFGSAAPHFHHRHREPFANLSLPHGRHSYSSSALGDNFRDGVFETDSFWMGLADEMHRIDQMLFDFTKHFAASVPNQGIEGNEYIIAITLNGFDQEDIVVKVREGVLMIQAVHKYEGGNQRNYKDLRYLPSYVNVAGSWTYDKGILKLVFPLTTKPEQTIEVIVTEKTIVEKNKSREDMNKDQHPVTEDLDVVDIDMRLMPKK